MAKDLSGLTRLEKVIRILSLQPAAIVAEARRVAARMGLKSLTPRQFIRYRMGEVSAPADKIRLIVAAMRSVSGVPLGAADLFDLEPATVAAGNGHSGVLAGSMAPGRVFSGRRLPAAWSFLVSDQRPSAEQTLEVLYREEAPLLRATARYRYRIPEADIDDLINDILASYLERQPKVDDVRAFLLGAIGNACKHYWRKRQRECPLLPEHDDKPDSATEAELERWTVSLSVGAMLARLAPKCRETLRRFYLDKEKRESIARQLSTTTGYVNQLLWACRKRALKIYRELTEPKR